jgi:hypothetical protein
MAGADQRCNFHLTGWGYSACSSIVLKEAGIYRRDRMAFTDSITVVKKWKTF